MPPHPSATQNHFFASGCWGGGLTAKMSAVSHSRHACCVTQQSCLLCHTANRSAVSHSRHVCSLTRQTRLRRRTTDISAESRSSRICCVTQQTGLLRRTADTSVCHIADMSAASHRRHVCCSTQLNSPQEVVTLFCHSASSQVDIHTYTCTYIYISYVNGTLRRGPYGAHSACMAGALLPQYASFPKYT